MQAVVLSVVHSWGRRVAALEARLGQGPKSNTERRLIGTLDVSDGRVFDRARAHADVATLIGFDRGLATAHPSAEVIYVAQDNWPVRFHPRVLEAVAGTTIRLLRLATYPPWTDPIEKLWRWLRQDVLHQPDFGDDWPGLEAAVETWRQK